MSKPQRPNTSRAFDPWSATIEEAMVAQGEFDDQKSPEGPVFQWVAVQELKEAQKHGLKDGFDILKEVARCAQHGLVMPEWLARAFLRRYRAVQQLHAGSWDDDKAFGRPYPKGAQIAAMRRRIMNRVTVALEVRRFIENDPDAPLDPEWDRIGEMVAKSAKEAQKLHAEAVKMGLTSTPGVMRSRLKFGTSKLAKLSRETPSN